MDTYHLGRFDVFWLWAVSLVEALVSRHLVGVSYSGRPGVSFGCHIPSHYVVCHLGVHFWNF